LLEDGQVRFAIEEERLNRIKHTNKFPLQALRACLESRSITLSDVDLIAYYSTREYLDHEAKRMYLANARMPLLFDATSFLQHLIQRQFDERIALHKFRFVHHHEAHAVSAFALSGYEESLVLTIDGEGDNCSGMALVGQGTALQSIADFPVAKSLGFFYDRLITYLGYGAFDEYKVMGLAPYGDPARYRGLFKTLYDLLPDGDYALHSHKLISIYEVGLPRRTWDPLAQWHKDFAAALQETLEEIVFHLLRHYKKKTNQRNLCLAGGVAHNCTLNGKILTSGLFENVFVQPAAHDAGCALGAALHAYFTATPEAKKHTLAHIYWGTPVGGSQAIAEQLAGWQRFISFEKMGQTAKATAELLAAGKVIGWVQGRSEFGPRALGNRSILADPRPAENKDRINQMVKKREGYRPFAPAVLEEEADEFFAIPPNKQNLAFMVFVVDVRLDKRQLLGAITHIDGTARVQTVSRQTNERFWKLLRAFQQLTGIPLLLNTSFNNNVEPIVDSVEDALVCFLTTDLDYLVVGDYLVKKMTLTPDDYLSLRISLPPYISLHEVKAMGANGQAAVTYSIQNSYNPAFQLPVSAGVFQTLSLADGRRQLGEILPVEEKSDKLVTRPSVREFVELWSQRLIQLRP
jgi:carbamoyltransferase